MVIASRRRRPSAEEVLIERILAGDGAAFEGLVALHGATVYRVVARHVGRGEAEDAAQETFLQIHKSLRGFQGRSSLSTWIYRVATTVALKRAARARRRVAALRLVSREPPPVAAAADVEAVATEERESVRRTLELLPVEQRAVVALRAVDGLSFKEIARVLGIPRPTAESRMFRGREALREWLRPRPSAERGRGDLSRSGAS
jgi:RNA polymerase sigma-70 factor (ECF subfamily)